MQFFGEIVIDVSAEQTERTAAAKGTITIPGSAQAGTGNGAVILEGAMDTESTETADTEIAVELPVIWQEDGKAEAFVTFELNDEEILTFHPQESWHSGKHTLALYYPIEQIIADYTNTFNVYLRLTKGTGDIGTGDCIASISGQSMAAAAAWDGKINIEETVGSFVIGGGLQGRVCQEKIGIETMELVQRSYTDRVIGRTAIGAFCQPIETTQEGL